MNRRTTYHILFALALTFWTLAGTAQDQPDTSRYTVTDIDSASQVQEGQDDTDEETIREQDVDTVMPARGESVYFQARQYQHNGGGPDSMQLRALPDSTVKKLKADNQFWYADYDFEKQKKPDEKEDESEASTPLIARDSFQSFLWILIICSFVAVLIIYLGNSNVRLFRRSSYKLPDDEDTVVETNNIFEINYQREIDKAVKERNFRQATRLMFLRLLRSLSDRKFISYQQDKTNLDYLLQLQSSRYYGDFARLTRFYEYSWYGQFEIDADKFPIIRSEFENLDKQLK